MSDVRQAVLLAAGAGNRLLPRTSQIPKCLVPIAGLPIVDHLLEALEPLELEELVVVTGWQHRRLQDHLGARRGRLSIRYVHNADFHSTNNIVSLHCAAHLVQPPFALLESDVLAEPAMLASLGSPDTMVVSSYEYGMTGTGVRLTADGRVAAIVLKAHEQPKRFRRGLFKTVNLASLSAPTWNAFRDAIALWLAEGRTGEFYEAVLADLVESRRVRLRSFNASALKWQEIDDERDLIAAESLLAEPRLAKQG